MGRFWLCSGRVLDDANRYEGKLIHNQIAEAVSDFVKQYGCRVFNLSVGDENQPYTGGHVRGVAVELDRLARLWGTALVLDEEPYALAVVVEEQGRNDVRFFSQMQAKLRQRERARGRAKH